MTVELSNSDIENIALQAPKPLSDKEVTDSTALLWKYNPVPSNEPEPSEDWVHDTLQFPGGEIIAARVRGKNHKHRGSNCDDWYEFGNCGETVFAAVSDGAGSKRFSRIGSRVSCQAAVKHMKNAFEKLAAESQAIRDYSEYVKIVQEAVIYSAQKVEDMFELSSLDPKYAQLLGRELTLKDFSATLLVAALVPIEDEYGKSRLVITCQIGDGISALLKTDGEFDQSLTLMGDADSGDYAGETEFLTSLTSEMLARKTKTAKSKADLFFMMTDGVADDYYPNNTEIRRLYFDLILNSILEGEPFKEEPLTEDENRIARKFLRGEKFTDDDMGLLKIIRRSKADSIEEKLKKLIIAYPWVSKNNPDGKITVPIQYTNRICEAMNRINENSGYGLKDIWENREILTKIKNNPDEKIQDLSKLLALWLDNYTMRSSSDDRTLLIMKFKKEQQV